METHVIQIGNSLGLRLPKAVLSSLGLAKDSTLRIETQPDAIVLRHVPAPRAGWADAFAADPAADGNLWDGVPADEGWDR